MPIAIDQLALNQCVAAQYAFQDRHLDERYGDYRKRLVEVQKQRFKDVLLAWIKFRDLPCAFEPALEQLAICEEATLAVLCRPGSA